jgi:hypothetical protein
MKTKTLSITILLFLALTFFAGTAKKAANEVTNQNPGISFTENKGQVHDQNHQPRPDVLYGTMTGNMAVHIRKTGVSYQLFRVDRYNEVEDLKTRVKRKEISQQTTYRVDLNWINANTNFVCIKDETLPGYNNYYLESCPKGALYVRSYKGVTLSNLYKGIDLHYYERNGELKHDYIVAANADYKKIQVKVEGAEISVNDDGSLLLTTPIGKIQEGAPIAYQNGKPLSARWKIDHNTLSFVVEGYNPNYELIIDPITRLWGTYYGGTGDDYGYSCSTDALGNVYLGGYAITNTGTIIATIGSHQSVMAGGGNAFLAKFNTNGIRQWATYYGGTGGSAGYSCATDLNNNVFLAGIAGTDTGTAIATVGSHQTSFGGGPVDAFLVKFDAAGVRQWGTYYGGLGEDWARSCTTDPNGNVYITGETASTSGTVIATNNGHQTSFGGGIKDAYLVKFDANGVRLWGTYYGGTTEDASNSCVTDLNGNVYVAGYTGSNSGTEIATVGSHQSAYGGGTIDAFLVKFDLNGNRIWGTYYGGSGDDRGYTCATDALSNIYFAGGTNTSTGTIIATPGSHQSTYAGLAEVFLVKFNSAGIRQWGTYYGGAGSEYVYSCTTDLNSRIYIVGQTGSNTSTAIATPGSHQPSKSGGTDAFLVQFNSNGTRQNATFYGGGGNDYGYSCSVDAAGNQFISGYTNTNLGTAIATSGAHQSIYGGGANDDGFLVKFAACNAPPQPTAILGNTIMCSGSGSNNYNIASVAGATSYTWSLPAGWSGSSNTNSISATPGSSGVFSVAAGNACGASAQQTLSVTVNPLPAITASSSSSILCEGESATLTASGASTYTFNPGGTGTTIVVAPPVTSVYTISGTDANGCSNTFIFTQNVDACLGINSNNAVASSGVEMYPNPTEGKINLELSSNCEVTIMNSLGQLVYETNLSRGKHELDLVHLAKGLYVVKVKSGKDLVTIKVIKD